MDQSEIDALLKGGSLSGLAEKQQEVGKHLGRGGQQQTVTGPKGEVIGQLSKVTEESEAGTNMVMNYLENVLSVITTIKNHIKGVEGRLQQAPDQVKPQELVTFLNDTIFLVEDLVFSAMDAFQFQDINRQKLLKVMYTLSKLNEYLNELLGHDGQEKLFGNQIESTSLTKDSHKTDVDSLIKEFKAPRK